MDFGFSGFGVDSGYMAGPIAGGVVKYLQIYGIDGVVLVNQALPVGLDELEKVEINMAIPICHPFEKIIIKEGYDVSL